MLAGILTTASIASAILAAIMATSLAQAQPPRQLITVGHPPENATLVACDPDGTFQFRIGEETRQITSNDLVRWSTPSLDLHKSELVLVDGSRLVVAESWTGQGALQLDEENVSVTTKLLGKVSVPRRLVQTILWNPPAECLRRTHMLDRLLAFPKDNDHLLLTNGDILAGQLLQTKSEQVAGKSRTTVSFKIREATTSFAADRVAGVAFKKSTVPTPERGLAIGLSDGSYLMTTALQLTKGGYKIKLASGIHLTGTNPNDIIHLQALGKPTYLSDLEAAEYSHRPYLDIPWPYQPDRNLQGGPLRVGGKIYNKGIAMHSESRLTFDLPRAKVTGKTEFKHKRFVAQAAIDDLAENGGSVVFRVLLRSDAGWQTAFSSPVLRGGDQPLAVTVELKNAKQIALVANYADRGDERDHANWLDARLE
ncbi:MAG: hypothetical protein GXP26_14685 [Planctomycetes bacterium]|nr:hypothetical protein [Planctomycetota bacterium]